VTDCHASETGLINVYNSDGARCLKVCEGVHEKPDLPEAFHKRSMCEFGEESGGSHSPPPKKKN